MPASQMGKIAPNMNLTDIAIGIKTFLRDEQLFNAIQAIRDTLPECSMVIADDGEHSEEKDGIYADLIREGHQVIWMDFDSGFGAKSNAIAESLHRPLLLIGSDDFDFRPKFVRAGIETMLAALNNNPDIDIVSGRVNSRPYEFLLEESESGTVITEVPVNFGNIPVWNVHLTVNYSLFRKHVFDKVRWDDDIRICGGEHGAQFVKIKRAGFKVGFCPTVNILEQKTPSSDRYKQYRNRGARSPERPAFEKLGIKKYVLGSGQVDYQT